ncbi:TonB-dependent receptor [Parapedobacter sp. 2B3]
MRIKLIILIMTTACLQLSANVFGQRVTLNEKDATLTKILKKIEKQSGYTFFYNRKDVKDLGPINLSVSNESVNTALEKLLKNKPYGFEIQGKIIVLHRKETPPKPSRAVAVEPEMAMQQRQVSGRVTDSIGNPLEGATVKVSGTNAATTTDVDGQYVLSIPEAGTALTYTLMGFESIERTIGSQSVINVALKESVSDLEEVVVVGYGTQRRVNLTGSVEVVDGKRLQNRPVNNVSQAFQGTVSGVTIGYGNSGFEPGAAPSVQIRGQGSPYVVIDGTVGDINTLDPNTIESISVLKDAAASAIYGARAPYGVLLITTKSGRENQKPQVDFSVNAGPTSIIDKPAMVDSYTFVRAMNEMHDNQGVARLFAESTIDRIIARLADPTLPETVPDANNPTKWSTYQFSNGDNDWIDVHYGAGYRTQENLSLRGGAKDISYFLSLGHAAEKGPLKMVDDQYRRYNMQAKLEANLTEWWKVSSNTRLTNEFRDRPIYNGEGGYGMLIHQILRTHPEVYLKSPNGHYSQLSRVPQMQAGYERFTDNNLMQRMATEITPIENWTINADYSIDYSVNNYEGANLVAYEDEVDGTLVPISLTVPSYLTKDKANVTYKALNIYSSYKVDVGNDHHFSVMAGFQQEENNYDYLRGLKRELITPEVLSLTTATGEMQALDDLSHWSTLGYFARLNYNFADRYLFESNVRYDGTSKFAEGKRWGLFPSFSAGWNISNEAFWANMKNHVQHLKLRGSWGMLGNQHVSAYQDLALLGVRTNLNWIVNGQRPAYTIAPNLVNPLLTWESSQSTNVAVEAGFFQNRLHVEMEYYQRLTFDRLGPAQALPAVIGRAIPLENNSELKTKGWDFTLRWNGKPGREFNYAVAASMFDYANVVSKYPNPTGILTTDYTGKRVGEIWGYETVGLIQTQARADEINATNYQRFINGQVWRTGDVEYRDVNGDGVIDAGKNTVSDHGDLRVIGNSTSRYQFGLNLTANYKRFDVGVFLQGTAKRDLWLSGNVFWGFQAWNQSSLFPRHMDYYRDEEGTAYSGLGINTDAYFPRPYSTTGQDNKNKQVQTRYLQNGAYMRLKNVQVGYTFPPHVLAKIGLKHSRIYFSGENIYTLTSLPSGFDPETATLGQYGNGKGMLSQAIWAFGLNVSL